MFWERKRADQLENCLIFWSLFILRRSQNSAEFSFAKLPVSKKVGVASGDDTLYYGIHVRTYLYLLFSYATLSETLLKNQSPYKIRSWTCYIYRPFDVVSFTFNKFQFATVVH